MTLVILTLILLLYTNGGSIIPFKTSTVNEKQNKKVKRSVCNKISRLSSDVLFILLYGITL